MLTNLSGNTAKWAQLLNQQVLNKSDPDPTLAKFITSFNGYLLDPERKGKAQKALRTFKQSGNMESYTHEQFNIHAYNSTWSDDILVNLYRGGLKENIRLAIISSANLPDPSASLTYRLFSSASIHSHCGTDLIVIHNPSQAGLSSGPNNFFLPSPLRTLIGKKLSGLNELMIDLCCHHQFSRLADFMSQSCITNLTSYVSNELVAYQRILKLTYITDLLKSMKSLFTSLYSSIFNSTFNLWIVPEAGLVDGFREFFKGWDQSFHNLLKDIDQMSNQRRGGIYYQKMSDLEKKASQRQTEDLQSLYEQCFCFNKKTGRLQEISTRNPPVTGTAPANKLPALNEKSDDSKTLSSTFIDKKLMGNRNQKGLYEVADYNCSRPNQHVQEGNHSPFIFQNHYVKLMIEQRSEAVEKLEHMSKILANLMTRLNLGKGATSIAKEAIQYGKYHFHSPLVGGEDLVLPTQFAKSMWMHWLNREFQLFMELIPKHCGNSKGPALTKGHQYGTKAGILLQIQNQRPKQP
ncbi:hypothetical protein VP01_1836g8 [Puccinia sorghi]|uniref:Signal recognition particle receptor alpha subunit N-terminal domain-containing protein n=1 Tax=Puccinia sorghi TaxID=27349 RepID=A0A0L6VED2_9BASI|nr:hypothetical protein VP01_1836g8 [Puccinia sorghi]